MKLLLDGRVMILDVCVSISEAGQWKQKRSSTFKVGCVEIVTRGRIESAAAKSLVSHLIVQAKKRHLISMTHFCLRLAAYYQIMSEHIA